jgi:hypothetical protein
MEVSQLKLKNFRDARCKTKKGRNESFRKIRERAECWEGTGTNRELRQSRIISGCGFPVFSGSGKEDSVASETGNLSHSFKPPGRRPISISILTRFTHT